jgi:hypothetical protein
MDIVFGISIWFVSFLVMVAAFFILHSAVNNPRYISAGLLRMFMCVVLAILSVLVAGLGLVIIELGLV